MRPAYSSHPDRLCPVCGSRLAAGRREWLLKCEKCGLLASSLQPAIPQERTSTAINEQARLSGLSEARRRSNAVILNMLSRLLPAPVPALLDVGCGHGLFLKDALAAGFACEGIEPDANVVDAAKALTGAVVRQGYFPDILGDDEQYDAIVFNDVLEHIPEAARAVTASRAHLRSGGILVLNCPDKGGIFYRLADILDRIGLSGPFLRMWQFGLPSPHVWYFGANHLERLGEKAGLVSLATSHLAPITSSGLRDRISYVQGQSKLMNGLTYIGALLLLPLLRVLPRDTSIVFLRRP